MRFKIISILLFCFSGTALICQDAEINRLIQGELKMNFPGIYFKHKSMEYANMPYTVDSCIKYIAKHAHNINYMVIWRDSIETENLTKQRINKLKSALSKNKETRNVYIESMGDQQKISRKTIQQCKDTTQKNYLLSLNSVFEIASTKLTRKNKFKSHIFYPRPWCISCWQNGLYIKTRIRLRKMERQEKLKLKQPNPNN